MTRFDEVARLRELEKNATPAPWDSKMQFSAHDVFPNGQFIESIRNTAPWLLEVAACFQPGDAEILHLMRNYLAAHKPDGHLIENGPSTARGVDCMTRLQKAAEIMEELE